MKESKILRKKRKCWLPTFSLFPTRFSKAFRVVELGKCGEGLAHTTQCRILTHQSYIAVENIVRKEEIACYKQFLFFSQCFLHYMVCIFHFKCILKCCLQFLSSPEHEVLMVSFCDRPMSVVCRASSVVHNFFKHLLLLNHWANLDETWQGCSLGEALPKLFKRLNSSQNSGCHGNQKEKNRKIFENLLLWN